MKLKLIQATLESLDRFYELNSKTARETKSRTVLGTLSKQIYAAKHAKKQYMNNHCEAPLY
jgi:hypothetical protein